MFRANFWTARVLFVTTLCTLVLFIGSLVLAFYGMGAIIDHQVKLQVQLKEGTDQWDRFLELPPLDFKVWFWDVQNADKIVSDGAMPELKEVGPFVYTQQITKNVTEMNKDEDSVTYHRKFVLDFDKTSSGNLTENTTFMIPNVALLVAIQTASSLQKLFLAGCIDQIFPENMRDMFINVTADEILFSGIRFAEEGDIGTACEIVRKKVIELSAVIKVIDRLDKDGKIVDRYDTDLSKVHCLTLSFLAYKIRDPDGIYTVNRGLNNVSALGQIMRWNNQEQLDLWGSKTSINNDTCKQMRGTDSTIYAPHINSGGHIDVYNTDVCRIVKISYTGRDTYSGISGYRYEADEDTFKYKTPLAENDCYCTKSTLDTNGNPSCFLDGVMDLRPCIGAPVLVSFPHFLHAPGYAEQVLGMAPDVDKHKITILIEPNTGTPLQGKERVQMNLVIKPELFIPKTTMLPRVVLPMFWIEEGINLPQKYIDLLNNNYFSKIKITVALKYVLIAITSAMFAVSLAFLVRKHLLRSRDPKQY